MNIPTRQRLVIALLMGSVASTSAAATYRAGALAFRVLTGVLLFVAIIVAFGGISQRQRVTAILLVLVLFGVGIFIGYTFARAQLPG